MAGMLPGRTSSQIFTGESEDDAIAALYEADMIALWQQAYNRRCLSL